jgi:hypothetical protein
VDAWPLLGSATARKRGDLGKLILGWQQQNRTNPGLLPRRYTLPPRSIPSSWNNRSAGAKFARLFVEWITVIQKPDRYELQENCKVAIDIFGQILPAASSGQRMAKPLALDSEFFVQGALLMMTRTFLTAFLAVGLYGLVDAAKVSAQCCEPACGCENACCEPSCGCENNCCDSCCCCRTGLLDRLRAMCCCRRQCRRCCGCCEPSCGCETGCCDGANCCCEPSCGCEDSCCGCGGGCCCRPGLLERLRARCCCRRQCRRCCGCCEPSCGCEGACGANCCCEPSCGCE